MSLVVLCGTGRVNIPTLEVVTYFGWIPRGEVVFEEERGLVDMLHMCCRKEFNIVWVKVERS